jgi:hypothetical protein
MYMLVCTYTLFIRNLALKAGPVVNVHMHEIFIDCFYTLFCIIHQLGLLIDTKHITTNISDNLYQILPFIQNFLLFPVFAKSAKHT